MTAQQLRNSILQQAIQGRLVPQDPSEGSASKILEQVRQDKELLVKEKKLKKDRLPFSSFDITETPFNIPISWEWVKLTDICEYGKCQSKSVSDIHADEWVLELEDIQKGTAHILKKLTRGQRDIKGSRHVFSKGQLLYSKLRTYLT